MLRILWDLFVWKFLIFLLLIFYPFLEIFILSTTCLGLFLFESFITGTLQAYCILQPVIFKYRKYFLFIVSLNVYPLNLPSCSSTSLMILVLFLLHSSCSFLVCYSFNFRLFSTFWCFLVVSSILPFWSNILIFCSAAVNMLFQTSIEFFVCFFSGTTSVVLRAYFCICTQGSLLPELDKFIGFQRLIRFGYIQGKWNALPSAALPTAISLSPFIEFLNIPFYILV